MVRSRVDAGVGIVHLSPQRGLRAERAAKYYDISVSLFLQLVEAGVLPPPLEIPGTTVKLWDLRRLDESFDKLNAADQGGGKKKNTWDE